VAARAPAFAESFRRHERLLWGLCYRMTGNAADADDLVQEAYARALERPPEGEMKPWLVKIALNLSRDELRRRRRRGYVGPWLPSPVELADDGLAIASLRGDDARAGSARYELLESASFAFLLALEVLGPLPRAVLLLRDVFDYSVRETAEALSISEANVKTTLHRARRALSAYEGEERVTDVARNQAVLQTFLGHLAAGDVDAVEKLLAADCRALSDGGGEFLAARVPVLGPAKITRFLHKITSGRPAPAMAVLRTLNGMPALVVEYAEVRPNEGRRITLACDIDRAGLVTRIYSVLATNKLTAVFGPGKLGTRN
jgi:RNA polymerase sigma factor (sigma-70 family)